MRLHLLVGSMLLMTLAACGGGGGGQDYTPTGPEPGTPGPNNPMTPPSNQVTVSDNEYQPASLVVPSGTKVTWSWSAGNYAAHSVTFNDGVGSSEAKSTGTHERTFTTAGSYPYSCTIHGTSMSGTVTVNP